MTSQLNIVVLMGLVAGAGCASSSGTSMGSAVPPPTNPVQVTAASRGVLPVGQEIDVRLQDTLSSATAAPEQRFTATTIVDLEQDGGVLLPAGSVVRGVVNSVNPAGRVDRSGSLTLGFDQLTVRGRSIPIRAMATQAFESRGIRDEGRTVGTGGAVGAIVGGIVGGLEGALIGAVVGAGGVIAATEGKDIELPAGTVVRIRLDSPVELR